jgi:hypothetical protein
MDRRRRNNEAAKRCREFQKFSAHIFISQIILLSGANRRAVFEFRSRRAQMLEAENGGFSLDLFAEINRNTFIPSHNYRIAPRNDQIE